MELSLYLKPPHTTKRSMSISLLSWSTETIKSLILALTLLFLLPTFLCLLFVMYVVGYFEVRTVDGLGLGYGSYKLNLLSIIDSTISSRNETWSWISPDIELNLLIFSISSPKSSILTG